MFKLFGTPKPVREVAVALDGLNLGSTQGQEALLAAQCMESELAAVEIKRLEAKKATRDRHAN